MYKVTNGNNFDFNGRYDGKDYKFPAGVAVYCDDMPAAHIFGLGTPNKSAILTRYGWATMANTYQDGMKILEAFAFEHMSPVYDAPLALMDDNDHGPAPVDRDAPAEGGADESPEAGAVEVSRRRGRPPGSGGAVVAGVGAGPATTGA